MAQEKKLIPITDQIYDEMAEHWGRADFAKKYQGYDIEMFKVMK